MLCQKTQVCFNEPHYVAVHSIMKIITASGAKMAQKIPQCF